MWLLRLSVLFHPLERFLSQIYQLEACELCQRSSDVQNKTWEVNYVWTNHQLQSDSKILSLVIFEAASWTNSKSEWSILTNQRWNIATSLWSWQVWLCCYQIYSYQTCFHYSFKINIIFIIIIKDINNISDQRPLICALDY